MPTTTGVARRIALVVEDDEQIASLLQFILEREGYEVLTAADGRAAIDRARHLEPPALAMLDVMLPYVDGYAVLDRLREMPGWDRVPVIVLSARAQEKDIVRGLDAGADDYLVKPFMPDELRARIRRLVPA